MVGLRAKMKIPVSAGYWISINPSKWGEKKPEYLFTERKFVIGDQKDLS